MNYSHSGYGKWLPLHTKRTLYYIPYAHTEHTKDKTHLANEETFSEE